jgi:hypothetical protein
MSLALCASLAHAQDFETIFGGRYQGALSVVRARQSSWRAGLEGLGADAQVLVPVVFPELLRRSVIREGMEDFGLATLYVSGGRDAADFSVGVFQMKPSFVETLEESLAALPSLPDALRPLLDHAGAPTGRDRRSLRYQRLLDEHWQLRYLAGFACIVGNRFPLESMGIEDRIRFLAAAYNHGYRHSREEIAAAGALQLFPNGARPHGRAQYRYTDVAVDFYDRYWRALINP